MKEKKNQSLEEAASDKRTQTQFVGKSAKDIEWKYSPNDGPIQYNMRGTVGVGSTPSRHGRANVIGTPGNAMTHDVVKGGGHTIEVQKERGSQFSEFSTADEQNSTIVAQSGTKTPLVRSKNAADDATRDNFGQVPPTDKPIISDLAGGSKSAISANNLPRGSEMRSDGGKNVENGGWIQGSRSEKSKLKGAISKSEKSGSYTSANDNSQNSTDDLTPSNEKVYGNTDTDRGGDGHSAHGLPPTADPQATDKTKNTRALSQSNRTGGEKVYGNTDTDRGGDGYSAHGLPPTADSQATDKTKNTRALSQSNRTGGEKVYGNTDTDRDIYGDFMAEQSTGSGNRNSSENNNEGGNEDTDNSDNRNTDGDDDKKDRAVAVRDGEKLIKTIVIAGQIEGHTQLPQGQKATRYEELIPQLVEIEECDEISGLLLILNTVGGDVEAGLALSELIAGMKKPTASLVLGGGHSIGVPLAVAARRSFIVPSATMTLHPVRVTGMVLSAPQTYVYLNNMQERIIDFTCSHCNISHERFYELMLAREEMSTDLGSVLDGKKAVEEGLIDSLGTLADAIRFLREGD